MLPSKQQHSFNIKNCQVHRRAHSVGAPKNLLEKCECCNFPYDRSEITSICYKASQTYYLGEGPSLYFSIIIYLILLFLLMSLGVSIVLIVRNSEGSGCLENSLPCSKSWAFQLSWMNNMKDQNSFALQTYVLGGMSLIIIILNEVFHWYLKRERQKILSLKDNIYHPNDFSVLLRFQQRGNYEKKEIQQMIGQWWERQLTKEGVSIECGKIEAIIQKIIFIFDMQYFNEFTQNLGKLQKDILSSPNEVMQGMEKLKQIEDMKEKIRLKELQKTNKCIIIFSNRLIADHFLTQNQSRFCCQNSLKFKNSGEVKVYKAPYPTQINYDNSHIHYESKLKNRTLINIILMLVVGTGWGILVFFLFLWKQYLSSNENFQFAIFFAFLICLTTLIECSISVVLSKYSKKGLQTELQISNMYKITFICLLKIAGLLPCAYLLFGQEYFSVTNGFIDSITYFFLLSIFILHLAKFLNFSVLSSIFHKKQIQNNKNDYTQKQANSFYEKPQFQAYFECGWMISLVLLSSFYASLVPLSLPFVLLYLGLQFCFQKIRFIHLCQEPFPFTADICFHTMYICKAIPFAIMLGNGILFLISLNFIEFQTITGIVIVNCLGLGLPLCSLLIPHSCCEKKYNDQFSKIRYQSIQDNLIFTYTNTNPVYTYKLPISKNLVNYSKNQTITQQLNTMSKSLEQTLKQRLFQQKVCLQELGTKRQFNDSYFEYEKKVFMEESKQKSVPLLFTPKNKKIKKFDTQEKQDQLQLWKIFKEGEDEREKKQFKEMIKRNIKMVEEI